MHAQKSDGSGFCTAFVQGIALGHIIIVRENLLRAHELSSDPKDVKRVPTLTTYRGDRMSQRSGTQGFQELIVVRDLDR